MTFPKSLHLSTSRGIPTSPAEETHSTPPPARKRQMCSPAAKLASACLGTVKAVRTEHIGIQDRRRSTSPEHRTMISNITVEMEIGLRLRMRDRSARANGPLPGSEMCVLLSILSNSLIPESICVPRNAINELTPKLTVQLHDPQNHASRPISPTH